MDHSELAHFVGSPANTKDYRIALSSGKVVIASDVSFVESKPPSGDLLQRLRTLPEQTGYNTSSKRLRHMGKLNLLIQTTLETSRIQTMQVLVKMIKLIRPILDRLKMLKIKGQERRVPTLLDPEPHLAAGGASNLRLQQLLSWKSPLPTRRS